jgi:transposase
MGNTTYRALEKKFNVGFKTIYSWVMKHQGKKAKPSKQSFLEEKILLSTDVKELQAELRKAQLHNKLLNAIIDIAEDQLHIDIRKKSGTKQ